MTRVLIEHASQIATPRGRSARRGSEMRQIQEIADGAIYIEDGIIKEVGPTDQVIAAVGDLQGVEVVDAAGHSIVPGFVDSHTHYIFGGYRPEEFLARLEGAGYLEIMKMGGGIQSTVNATKACSEQELYRLGLQRLDEMLAQGVTTMEGKSGYGLDLDCELKQLRAMQQTDRDHPVEVVPTYLGGHAVPPEYRGDPDGYVDFMIKEVLPRVKELGLATFCDVFCEDSVFSIEQSRRLLRAAQEMGFGLKMHADEIVSLGGAELAAELGAVSADHLLMASDLGIAKLAATGTVATLLPSTAFCLAHPYAPGRKMIDAGCAVALASDYNPGSCFTNSIPLILALAGIHMHLSIEEVLTGATLNGAAAVGRADRIGSLEPGKQADFLLLRYPDYRFLVYHSGVNIVEQVYKKGRLVYGGRP